MDLKGKKQQSISFHIQWIVFLISGFLALREFYLINILAYVPKTDLFKSRRFIVFLLICFIAAAVWITYYFLHKKKYTGRLWSKLRKLPFLLKAAACMSALMLPGLLKWMLPLPKDFNLGPWIMILLFYLAGSLSSTLISDDSEPMRTVIQIAAFFMVSGFGYGFFARMNQVTAYPFPIYWSEGNRFFDYSTLLGSSHYIFPAGEKIKAFINWGMALPWALPFVLPKISIGTYRFWYQLVWIIPSMLLGFFAIDKRKKGMGLSIAVIFAFWAYLFLDQGPIYSPLVLGAVLTVIAVRQKLPVGMILIIAASYYVRNARWTWGYAPGLWAGMLALLAIHEPSLKKERIKDLAKPVALGLAGYFGGHLLPSIINIFKKSSSLSLLPNPTSSITRQTLIWERLWPNATYPPGIVLGLVWAVLPVLIFVIVLLIKKQWKLNWMQNLSWVAVCFAFLTAGIIASTKIGGGSNLHNLDMFLISVLLLLASAINYLAAKTSKPLKMDSILVILLVICLLAPVTYSLQSQERLVLPEKDKIAESLSAVQNKVEEYSTKGEILFIDHRQLLTFSLVKNVHLIDDYEKKYLMDNALSANASYFESFYKDLAEQRFALIVNEPTNIISRGSEYSFGEENDAYVKWITAPLVCTYEPLYTSQATALELLIPRTTPAPSYLHCDEIYAGIDE